MFQGSGGRLIIEAESADPVGYWTQRNIDNQVAMLWDAPTSNYRRAEISETMSYSFTTDESGRYFISLHSGRVKDVMNPSDRFENGEDGEERRDTGNDIYFSLIDVETGDYVVVPSKIFTGLGDRDEEARWGTRFDVNGQQSDATINLDANKEYRLEIAGRSDGYFFDKIVLNKDSFVRPNNDADINALEESTFDPNMAAVPFDGTDGNDVFQFLGGNADRPYDGKRGNDQVTGSDQAEDITGGQGDDTISAAGGNDEIADTLGNNTINGGDGNDTITGGIGELTANGNAGNDILIGGIGNDALSGGAGSDFIQGDPGNSFFYGDDTLIAGQGTDYLEGGEGADTFVFNPGDGNNTIADLRLRNDNPTSTTLNGSDFQSGIDTVDLSGFGYTSVDQVFDQMTDVNNGRSALFSDQGTEILFHLVNQNGLDAGDFII